MTATTTATGTAFARVITASLDWHDLRCRPDAAPADLATAYAAVRAASVALANDHDTAASPAVCDECGTTDGPLRPHPHAGVHPHGTDAMRCETCGEGTGDGTGYRTPDNLDTKATR